MIAIISIMMALLVATLGTVRGSARSFECKNKLKTIGFEFFQYADDFSSAYRQRTAPDGFRGVYIDTFQEMLYGVDEFWDRPSIRTKKLDPAQQLLMCPAGPGRLEAYASLPCDGYPVRPVENVSIGFNMRLRSASAFVRGRPVLKNVRLTSRILQHTSVPLAFDVEGAAAAQRQVLPYYAAPPAGDAGRYGSGLFWFPSDRHRMLNAVFIGGHVMSTANPEKAASWNWKYQPAPE